MAKIRSCAVQSKKKVNTNEVAYLERENRILKQLIEEMKDKNGILKEHVILLKEVIRENEVKIRRSNKHTIQSAVTVNDTYQHSNWG